jgi:putative sterol carrier protein
MRTRAVPPPDIAPLDFFTRWLPEVVAADADRRRRLGSTCAVLVFELSGDGGGAFAVHVENGEVRGSAEPVGEPQLRVRLDLGTWRELNAGTLSAPEALLRRRVHLEGDYLLALKLHLIIG